MVRLGTTLCVVAFAGILSASDSSNTNKGSNKPSKQIVDFHDIALSAGFEAFHQRAGSPAKPYLPDTIGSGVALFDFNNDGWLDVYLLNALTHEAREGRSALGRAGLFRNNRDGTFSDVTMMAGLGNERWGTGVCAGDFNNDGWEDLFVANLGVSRLYRNEGNGKFSDVATDTSVAVDTWATGCAFGDYDKDGFLDLYVATYVAFDWDDPPPSGPTTPGEMPRQQPKEEATGTRASYDAGRRVCTYQGLRVACGPQGLKPAADFLFRNRNGRSFEDVTGRAGISSAEVRYGFAVAWADIDNDGWLDIVVANDGQPNYLFHNNGHGQFEELGLLSGLGTTADGRAQAYMGIAVGDYNQDGLVDFYITTFSAEPYTLYRNDGNVSFTDVTFQMGLGQVTVPLLGWGAEFLDYDNDGWLDIFTANGHIYPQVDHMQWNTTYRQKTLVLRNDAGKQFADVTASLGRDLTRFKSSRGAAKGDLFNDGDIDVVLNNLDGQATVLENRGGNHAGNWIAVKLVGDPSEGTPRDAIGTVVYCSAGGRRQRADVASGRGFLSQSDLRVHFGLDLADLVDKLEIVWANGSRETHKSLKTNRILTIVQGEGIVDP